MSENVVYKLKDMRDAYVIEHELLTPTQSANFIMAGLLEKRVQEPFNKVDANMLGDRGLILWGRITKPHEVLISKGVGVVVADACDSPGELVVWALTLHRIRQERGLDMVTLEDIAVTFAEGFPTKKAFEAVWDDQKAYNHGEQSGRNLIDDPAYW